jgi:hypothetical protein
LSAEQRRKLQELEADRNFAGIRFKNEPSTWFKELR